MAETPFYRKGRVRSLPFAQFKKCLPFRNRMGNCFVLGLLCFPLSGFFWLLSRPHPTWFIWEDGCGCLAALAVGCAAFGVVLQVAAVFCYRRARQIGEYAYAVKPPDGMRILRFGWRSSFHVFWRDRSLRGTQAPGPLLRDAFCFVCFAALSWLFAVWVPHLILTYRRMLDPEIVADREVFLLIFRVSVGVWSVAAAAKVLSCVWIWRKLLWPFARLLVCRSCRWLRGLHFAGFSKRLGFHAVLTVTVVGALSLGSFLGCFCPPPWELRNVASGQGVLLPEGSPRAFLHVRQSRPNGIEYLQFGTRELWAWNILPDGDDSTLFSEQQMHYLSRVRGCYYQMAFDTALERGHKKAVENGWHRAKVAEITETYAKVAQAVREEPLISWEEAAVRIQVLDDRLSLTPPSKSRKSWELKDNSLPDSVFLYADWCRLHCSDGWIVLWTMRATIIARPSTGTLLEIREPTRYACAHSDGDVPTVASSTFFVAVIAFLLLAPIVYLTPPRFVLCRPDATGKCPRPAGLHRRVSRAIDPVG